MAPAIGIPTAPSLPTVHEDETPLNSSLLSPLVSPSSVGSGGVGMEGAGGMQRVRSTASMTVPVTENDPLGALTPPANHQSPTNKGLVKSATCPNNDLYNVGNNRAKTPVKTGEVFLFTTFFRERLSKRDHCSSSSCSQGEHFSFTQQPSALGLYRNWPKSFRNPKCYSRVYPNPHH